ncbi:Rossmann-fold NAD(P)-binding domain-containing protein [Methanosarcina mazei]|uniref:Uncharacterized protein n=1 Tax=Methanosarcina mazei TaxID=2209 RepID=A0A0F8IW64_METMZ|nr:hypothetical protein [Methanosarcina mazei]KKG83649.1 hypothetical protein DU55_04140 [Methanosarcina mazei]
MKLLIIDNCESMGNNFTCFTLKRHSLYQIINYNELTYSEYLNNPKNIENNLKYFFLGEEYFFAGGGYYFTREDICGPAMKDRLMKEAGSEADSTAYFAVYFTAYITRLIKEDQVLIRTNSSCTGTLHQTAPEKLIEKFIRASTGEASGDTIKYLTKKMTGFAEISRHYQRPEYPEKSLPDFTDKVPERNKVSIHGSGFKTGVQICLRDYISTVYHIHYSCSSGEVYSLESISELSSPRIVYCLT